jgi:hypothetical protein
MAELTDEGMRRLCGRLLTNYNEERGAGLSAPEVEALLSRYLPDIEHLAQPQEEEKCTSTHKRTSTRTPGS